MAMYDEAQEARDGSRISGSGGPYGDGESKLGYRRIQGALSNLRHTVARGVVLLSNSRRGACLSLPSQDKRTDCG
jgi:hypothetical protein